MILGPTSPWTDFESENGFGKLLSLAGYNTGTGFYRAKLFFESENGFQKVFILATILVQVFIDQSYSLTPQMPIRTESSSPDNGNSPGDSRRTTELGRVECLHTVKKVDGYRLFTSFVMTVAPVVLANLRQSQ
jgi:hypothetical protein